MNAQHARDKGLEQPSEVPAQGTGGACEPERNVAPPVSGIALETRCAVVLALSICLTWLLNQGVFPVTSLAYPLAREFQTIAGAVFALGVLVVAQRAPRFVGPVIPTVACVAAAALGCGILLLWPHDAWGVTVGLVLAALGRGWLYFVIGMALSLLPTGKRLLASVACGLLAGALITVLAAVPSYVVSLGLMFALICVSYGLLFGPMREALAGMAKGQGLLDLAVSNPRSFLPAYHQVYVLILLFSGASGFALSLHIDRFTPLTSTLSLGVLGVVALWVFMTHHTVERIDGLFRLAALLVVGGFLAAPLGTHVLGSAANGMLAAGRQCFEVVSWTVLAALCARNPAGALVVLAYGDFANSCGTFLGADLGHLGNALVEGSPDAVSVLAGGAVLTLFAYVLYGLRGFSFAATIQGVVPAVPVQELAAATAPSRDARMAQACDELAQVCGLTAREREVLGLLARGRTSKAIQESLTLSYNTVKTHVKRIYRKLGVHAQQELMDLVEERMG